MRHPIQHRHISRKSNEDSPETQTIHDHVVNPPDPQMSFLRTVVLPQTLEIHLNSADPRLRSCGYSGSLKKSPQRHLTRAPKAKRLQPPLVLPNRIDVVRFTESEEGKEREERTKRHLSGDSTPVVTR